MWAQPCGPSISCVFRSNRTMPTPSSDRKVWTVSPEWTSPKRFMLTPHPAQNRRTAASSGCPTEQPRWKRACGRTKQRIGRRTELLPKLHCETWPRIRPLGEGKHSRLDGGAALDGGFPVGDGIRHWRTPRFNIREWAGSRKQKPITRLESRSKHVRCLLGIGGRLEHPRGLGSHYAVLIFESRAARVGAWRRRAPM